MRNNIILASSSPRRREICEKFGIRPTIIKASISENVNGDEDPSVVAMALSFEKARSVASELKGDELVLGADTIVVLEGKILQKPKNRLEAYESLKSLSGKRHKVITGIALVKASSNEKYIDYVETIVEFKELTDKTINRYIDTGEPMDKAGSYGIQGFGQLLIERIEGSYLNVVGLPIERVADIMKEYFYIRLI